MILTSKLTMSFIKSTNECSSIQHNFYSWTSNSRQYSLPNWSWPVPEPVYDLDVMRPGKLYAVLVRVLTKHPRSRKYRKKYTSEQIIQMFREELYHAWMSGYNVVIGAELLDSIGLDYSDWIDDDDDENNNRHEKNPPLDGMLDIMPWRFASTSITQQTGQQHDQPSPQLQEQHLVNGSGSDADITFVVTYRAPRASHVISLWHQCCAIQKMIFSEYLVNYSKRNMKKDPLVQLDSLNLAQILLGRGFKVVLVDMDGVTSQGYDLTNYVACQVLKVPCDSETNMIKGMKKDAKVYNNKSRMDRFLDVPQKYIEMIEREVRAYDCRYKDMVLDGHVNLTMLHPQKLIEYMEECVDMDANDVDEGLEKNDHNSTFPARTRDDLLQKLISIGTQFREETE